MDYIDIEYIYVEGNGIFDEFQSVYTQNQSTETASLKITNYILMHSDKGEHSTLVLLNQSAAFAPGLNPCTNSDFFVTPVPST